MKVTLAYPWIDSQGKEHKADTTVTVDDATGRSLIHDGKARPADNQKD